MPLIPASSDMSRVNTVNFRAIDFWKMLIYSTIVLNEYNGIL